MPSPRSRAESCSTGSARGSSIRLSLVALVVLHPAAGPGAQSIWLAARLSPRPRARRSALLSGQQPHPRHLVSAAERARATGVYAVGQYFGLAFLSPVLFWIAATFGWRWLFVIVGGIGIVYGLLFYRALSRSDRQPAGQPGRARSYRAPAAASTIGRERRLLLGGGSASCCRKRQILGASIGQFAGNSTLVFFLTWFPTYLATERGTWTGSSPASSPSCPTSPPRSAC